jgi:3D (Asp-Asp-Asp) domain-containing protein
MLKNVLKFKNKTYFVVISILLITSCESKRTKSLEVSATAYNSVKYQTDSKPNLTYWGDTLKPGMNVIAISHDLLDSGLTHKTEVEIEGFDGTYLVYDLMDNRWKRKIDIYMGKDIDSALNWGEKKVIISWQEDDD